MSDFNTQQIHPGKFRLRTQVVFGCLILAFVFLIDIVLDRLKSEAQEDIRYSLSTVLNSTSDGLTRWVQHEILQLEALSEHQSVQDFIHSPDGDALSQVLQEFQLLQDKFGYPGFFLLNPQGELLAASTTEDPKMIPLIVETRPDLFAQVIQGQSVWIPPQESPIPLIEADNQYTKNSATMFVVSAIKNPSGQVVGVLAHRQDPYVELKEILELARIGQSGESYLVGAQGEMLSTSRFNDQLVKMGFVQPGQYSLLNVQIRDPGVNLTESGQQAPLDRVHELPLTKMAAEVVDKQGGFSVDGYHDYRGVVVQGAWKYISKLGVGMTTEIDFEEGMEPYHLARTMIFLLCGVILLLISMAYIIVYRYQITMASWNRKKQQDLVQLIEVKDSELTDLTRDLKLEKDLFESLVVHIPGVVYRCINDDVWTMEYISDYIQELSGYPASDFLANRVRDYASLVLPEDMPYIEAELEKAYARDGVFNIEYRILDAQGEIRYVHEQGQYIPSEIPEHPGNNIGFIRDITEARRIQAELVQAKDDAYAHAQAKSEFLASMSHELRTPLNGVVGVLELMAGTQVDEEQMKLIKIADSSAHSLLSVVNDILDFSKIDAGKLEIESIEFNLRELLGELMQTTHIQASSREIKTYLDVSGIKHRQYLGDPTRLRQVLYNLLGNALKFPESGSIEHTAWLVDSDQPRLHCQLKDTGIGIPQDKQKHLFEMFSQADSTTTRKFGGTGLGLAICKKLVELMGGDIQVQSLEGQGSTFSFAINLEALERPQLDEPQVDLRVHTILILDPDPQSSQILMQQLEVWGPRVIAVQKLSQWQQILESNPSISLGIINSEYIGAVDLEQVSQTLEKYSPIKWIHLKGTSPWEPRVGDVSQLTHPWISSELINSLEQSLGLTKTNVTEKKIIDGHFKKPIHALLVDDNKINQTVARKILTKLGLEITSAHHGQEALEILSQEAPFDIVFMDCQMPIMDGYEATRRIRGGEAGSTRQDLTIIAMTANALAGDREKCLESGMDEFITKPISQKAIVQVLQELGFE